MEKRITVVSVVILVLLLGITGTAQVPSYEDFLGEFIKQRAQNLEEDANEFEMILNRWSNGEVSQSQVVAKLKEMEARAEQYFTDVLRLPPPEAKFDRYKQSIYVFVTWYNIIGIFTDGMADLDLAKLDAASTLSDHFEKTLQKFEGALQEPIEE